MRCIIIQQTNAGLAPASGIAVCDGLGAVRVALFCRKKLEKRFPPILPMLFSAMRGVAGRRLRKCALN